jgi:Flp pilus assembly pilin Flp
MVEYVLLIGVVVLLSIAAFQKFGWKVRSTVDHGTEAVVNDDD